MEMVEWDDCYNIGIETVDKHHQHLIALLNRSYNAIMFEHDSSEIVSIFNELIDYTDYHFKAEEEMMSDSGYSQMGPHVKEHETFKAKLNLLGAKVDADVIYFLEEWLLNHIAITDKAFANFVKAKGI